MDPKTGHPNLPQVPLKSVTFISNPASSPGESVAVNVDEHLQSPLLNSKDKTAVEDIGAAAPSWLLPVIYGVMNLVSVVMIVLANKVVLYSLKFSFAVTLSWIHTIFTALGMTAMSAMGVFQVKKVPLSRSVPVAVAYVGYIALNNLSIQTNTVGFYQLSKIAITPVVVVIEAVLFGKRPSGTLLAAIGVLLIGVTLSTVTDSQVASNPLGIFIAAGSVLMAALYQVWAGSKQKELGLSANQLLHQVAPPSVALLGLLIPALEPIGLSNPEPGTVLGYPFSVVSIGWILLSSVLGLVVTLSAFLFIGATSSLTYNVVGHLKTVAILTAGVFMFGDEMSGRKLAGLVCTMGGIVWYTDLSVRAARAQ